MTIRATAAGDLIERYSGLCPYDAITASAYIYITDRVNEQKVFVQQASAGLQSDMLKVGTDGKLEIHTYAHAQQAFGTTVLALNTWHQVAFVRSGNVRYAYLNGSLEATLDYAESWTKVGEGFYGLWGETAGGGSMGAIKMWSAVLNASEIEAERYGYDPVRTANLQTVSRLLDASSLGNEVEGGVGWSAYGSLEEGQTMTFPSEGGGGSGKGALLMMGQLSGGAL